MTSQNQESITKGEQKNIIVNFEDFELSEESFKPMTKGLGFHHELKTKAKFKTGVAQGENRKRDNKSNLGLNKNRKNLSHPLLNDLSQTNQVKNDNRSPSGLEAFYGNSQQVSHASFSPESFNEIKEQVKKLEIEESQLPKSIIKSASSGSQFVAWFIDLLMVASFVAVTLSLFVYLSGLSPEKFFTMTPQNDLYVFPLVLFSIYYLLYFTILDIGSTPGKTIMGIKLIKNNNQSVEMKHSFIRALVSLLSFVALFLPMLVDFQGRLSDTKLVRAS